MPFRSPLSRTFADCVADVLAAHGWPGLTLSDAVEILVSQGIRPSSIADLDAVVSAAKARMSWQPLSEPVNRIVDRIAAARQKDTQHG